MVASLVMYQRPQLIEAHNRYWALIRKHLSAEGIECPEALSQDADEFSVCTDPGLILAQTCGMPYRTWLHDRVALVGTPDFGVESCPPGYYRSAIIVRNNDEKTVLKAFKDSVFAYNHTFSQSGYAAPYWHVTSQGFWFEKKLRTGQHLESARAVVERKADIAALDAVSWRLMLEYESFAQDLRVLEWTSPTPGLPYIAAKETNVQITFNAVEKAIAELSDVNRKKLGINGLVHIPEEDYLAIPNP